MNKDPSDNLGEALVLESIQCGSLLLEGIPPCWTDWAYEIAVRSAVLLDMGVLHIRKNISPQTLLRLLDKLNNRQMSCLTKPEFSGILSVSGSTVARQWLVCFEHLPGLFSNTQSEELDISLGQLCFGASEHDGIGFCALALIIGPEIPVLSSSMSFSDRSRRLTLKTILSAVGKDSNDFWKLTRRDPADPVTILRASSLWCNNKPELKERLHHLLGVTGSAKKTIDDRLFPFVEVKNERSALVETMGVHRSKLIQISDIERSSTPVQRAEWLAARIPPGCVAIWTDRYLSKVKTSFLSPFLERLLSLIKHDSTLSVIVGDFRSSSEWHGFKTIINRMKLHNPQFNVRLMDDAAWNQLHERHLYLIDTGQILILPTADRLTAQSMLDNYIEVSVTSNRVQCVKVKLLEQSCSSL